MKRPFQILSITALIVGASVVTTLVTTPAKATKRASLESGNIAFVDVFTLVDRALTIDEKKAERDDFNIKSTEAISGLRQQLQTIQTQLSTMKQDDPNASTVYQQYQNLQYQLDNASKKINADYQTLIAQQIAWAYSNIYTTANELAAQEGFAFVFATRSDGELIQTDSITGITQEILARPLITPPNSVDLTEIVRVKLGYPEEAPEPVVEDAETNEPGATEPAVEPAVEEPATPADKDD